ncbi:MAG: tetratricopeptide repeat protein [Butyrivibrio sp.]|nr:tetratricopeptide repeat protein [Butyrivibrio sp.]
MNNKYINKIKEQFNKLKAYCKNFWIKLKAHLTREVKYKTAKYVCLTVMILAAIIMVLIGYRLIANTIFVKAYEKGDYKQSLEQSLESNSIVDPYLVDYNLGCSYYEQGDFDEAQTYFEKSLMYDIPEKKECPVRINLALTITKLIDFETINTQYASFKQGEEVDTEELAGLIEDAITQLQSAREVLTQVNCAGKEDDNGHSAEAESLKKDIDEEIDILKQMLKELGQDSSEEDDTEQQQKEENQKDNENSSEDNSNSTSDSREEKIKEKMEEQQRDALKEQNETQNMYEEYEYFNSDEFMENGFDSQYGQKNW